MPKLKVQKKNQMNIFILAFFPCAILGTINWLYWRSKGYRSFETLFFSYCAFYALGVLVLKIIR